MFLLPEFQKVKRSRDADQCWGGPQSVRTTGADASTGARLREAQIAPRCDGSARRRRFGRRQAIGFERLLETCEKDAHEIACEAGEEASSQASRTEISIVAYEVAYIEAYAEALPALVASARGHGPVKTQRPESHASR